REHRVDATAEADLVRESHEELERLVGEEVLREVDVKVARGAREPLSTLRVGSEPAAQVAAEGVAVLGERAPGVGRRGVDGGGGHEDSSFRSMLVGPTVRPGCGVLLGLLEQWPTPAVTEP